MKMNNVQQSNRKRRGMQIDDVVPSALAKVAAIVSVLMTGSITSTIDVAGAFQPQRWDSTNKKYQASKYYVHGYHDTILTRNTPNSFPMASLRKHSVIFRDEQLFDRRTQLFLSNTPEDELNDTKDSFSGGSIAGASLLFAGTAIGAGMLALPAETLNAGFVPSIFGLILCWAFTFVTSIVTLEASWLASQLELPSNNSDGGGGFLSISRTALGVPGEIVTATLFWFLITSIIVAYTAEGGRILSQVFIEVTHANIISASFGSAIFATFFASFATYGTSRVDTINRIFVFGLIATFIGLVGIGLPIVKGSNLLSNSDWSAIYLAGISIGILSFGAQNVVPTLLRYLNNDPIRTRRAILFGSLLPLLLYTIWEAIFLGIVDASTVADGGSNMEVVAVLGQIGGTDVTDLVEVFSICAIGSSMAGASVSLVDFFQDAIGILSIKRGPYDEKEQVSKEEDNLTDKSRLLAAFLALGPPVILAYAFPDIFLVALEEAGLLGGVSLYGIIPALSIISLRRSSSNANVDSKTLIMPGRLEGGDVALFALVAISSGLVLPELLRLGDML